MIHAWFVGVNYGQFLLATIVNTRRKQNPSHNALVERKVADGGCRQTATMLYVIGERKADSRV
jgi:hypothetical protein